MYNSGFFIKNQKYYKSFCNIYFSGIFNDPGCNANKCQLDHGVLLVGYGTENGQGYWLIKNSWGAKWGEEGYIKVAKGVNNCDILQFASYPLV